MSKITVVQIIPNESQMMEFGGNLAQACGSSAILFFYGDLGAGKTTLARGFLRGLSYEGKVKSPTYTIVEPYHIQGFDVYHFDFYRVQDPEELEFIGIQDYFTTEALCLVEWPEHGLSVLPLSDISCYITPCEAGRQVHLEAHTPRGDKILKRLISIQG